jgi:putative ABC transport system permease protein
MSGLPVTASFTFSLSAFSQTFFYFLAVYAVILAMNVVHVFRTNPNDLLKGAKKGDKEPKRLWLSGLLGAVILGAGYAIAIPTKVDSNLFLNFLLAVSLVCIGTHQFFKAGLLALLKLLKRNSRIYYRKSNYVTISGMLHRMKKSASSLSNICIFSTMTIITLLCTLSVWLGSDSMLDYRYPYDLTLNFNRGTFRGDDELNDKLQEFAEKNKVSIADNVRFTYQKLSADNSEDTFPIQDPSSPFAYHFTLKLISLDDYNVFENRDVTLDEDEVLMYSTGPDFGYDHVILENETYRIKEELSSMVFGRKSVKNTFGKEFFLIVRDTAVMDKLRDTFSNNAEYDRIFTVRLNIEGPDENREEFIRNVIDWSSKQPGYNSNINGITARRETISMNGGLLFIGIFFSIIFTMCLILIMYYKQITEGYDDRESFDIMQKVGMSDAEVRNTIRKQILLVFFSPLVMALLHTMAGFNMTAGMLSTLSLFDTGLIVKCGLIVSGFFAILYGLSYSFTSRTYYKIVKQMNGDDTAHNIA